MANQVYKETQSYRGTWIIYLIILIELPTIILLLTFYLLAEDKAEMGVALTIVAGTMALIFLFIFNLRLETRIDQNGISFKYFPFIRSWRKYPKESIKTITVINYSPITDFGGWGLKGNKTTKAYSITGNQGLLFDVGENKKIMIGTMKAKELEEYLSTWKEK
jgi:hypothetical protein